MKVICDKVSEECGKTCEHSKIHEMNEVYCSKDYCNQAVGKESECVPVEENKIKSNVINYQVVTGWDAATLEDGVRLLLSEGWEISGGISVSMDSIETILFCQAMVKNN